MAYLNLRRFMLLLATCTLVLWTSLAISAEPAKSAKGYNYYSIGDIEAKTPGQVRKGLMLLGGGDWPYDAFRWFFDRAGNGHIVVLRASYGDENQREMFNDIGGVKSVQTIVFHDRKAATDPKVLKTIAMADGIFFGGGDQSNYVNFWKGTPVQTALNKHVAAGKPVGGTSAGLAILGRYVYGAMDGRSLTSAQALQNSRTSSATVVENFLKYEPLYAAGVFTDSHFAERDRQARLMTMMALMQEKHPKSPLLGLGLDEDTAMVIDDKNRGTIISNADSHAWMFSPGSSKLVADGAAQTNGWKLTRLGRASAIQFNGASWRAINPELETTVDIRDGKLVYGKTPAPSAATTRVKKTLPDPILVIHGGAGGVRKNNTPADEVAIRDALKRALLAGHVQLQEGNGAADAVVAAIKVLEDDPNFNAGKGAVFTHDGKNELDASIMDGFGQRAGAIAAVNKIRNPIEAARAVMEKSEHVMMVGAGAETFAKEQGLTIVDPSYFRTEKRWNQLQKILKEEANNQASNDPEYVRMTGTVGAVALDVDGELAAGTSTGGMTNKRWGRVGDAPIIGAGTWADDTCAFSGTGWGEYYIRNHAAGNVCARVKLLGESAAVASGKVINGDVVRMGGDGGAIVLTKDGKFAFTFNTEAMYRGWIGKDGVPHVALYTDDLITGEVLPAAKSSAEAPPH